MLSAVVEQNSLLGLPDQMTRQRSRLEPAPLVELAKSRHRLLDHSLLAVEREQLLGAFLAAQRPEARAAPSSQNYRI